MLFYFILPGKSNDSNWNLARLQLRLLQESACGCLMRMASVLLVYRATGIPGKTWKCHLGKVTPGFALNNSNNSHPPLPLAQLFALSSPNIIHSSLLKQQELLTSWFSIQAWGCGSSWGSSPTPGSCWPCRACTRWLLVGLVTCSCCSQTDG